MVRSATGKGEAPAQPANDASISPAVEQSLADERGEAALEAEEAALDQLSADGDSEGVEAIIAGASPDDAARMRDYLGLPKPAGRPRKTSDDLADDWRRGGYPYKFKMLRKDYEREKFILQTELLKLQQLQLARERAAAVADPGLTRFNEQIRGTADLLSSSIEDAIIDGSSKGFKDLEKQLVRMVINDQFTKPLGDSINKFLRGLGDTGGAGGTAAGGGGASVSSRPARSAERISGSGQGIRLAVCGSSHSR